MKLFLDATTNTKQSRSALNLTHLSTKRFSIICLYILFNLLIKAALIYCLPVQAAFMHFVSEISKY